MVMAGALLILAGIFIGLYALAVLLGDKEPDGTVRESIRVRRKNLTRKD